MMAKRSRRGQYQLFQTTYFVRDVQKNHVNTMKRFNNDLRLYEQVFRIDLWKGKNRGAA